jgi:glucose/arabinose dehydrogenase
VMEPAYEKPDNLKVTAPVFELPAHVSPMGLLFYRGEQFPAEYHNQLLVAENGSWNRSSKIGYQIVVLSIDKGEVANRETLISFLDGEFPVARPYAMAMGTDGSLFISDDLKGNVYRFFFKHEEEAATQEEQP